MRNAAGDDPSDARMRWAKAHGAWIDEVFRRVCREHGEEPRLGCCSPLETIAAARLRKLIGGLSEHQRAVIDSARPDGLIVADHRKFPKKVYTSLVLKGLLVPTHYGDYRLVDDLP